MDTINKPKAILFDFDGVTNVSKYFSFIYAQNYHIPQKDVQKVFDDGRKDLTNIGKADLKDVMSEVLADWQWKGTVDELLDLWFKADLDLNMPLINSIQDLRKSGIKCYLVTDQEKYRTEYLWNKRKIKQYFDGKFISCEIGYTKHQIEFFEFTIKKLQLPAEDILYIDDAQSKLDVAKQSRIQTHLYTSFEECETFINSLYS